MRKLLLVWAAVRLARAVAAITLIAVLGMLVLTSGATSGKSSRGALAKIERAVPPPARELERTLEKGSKP